MARSAQAQQHEKSGHDVGADDLRPGQARRFDGDKCCGCKSRTARKRGLIFVLGEFLAEAEGLPYRASTEGHHRKAARKDDPGGIGIHGVGKVFAVREPAHRPAKTENAEIGRR